MSVFVGVILCFYIIRGLLFLLIPFVCTLLAVAFITGVERTFMGGVQRRKGPNRAGLWGILQPFSDGLKLFLKMISPISASSTLFIFAPFFCMLIAFTTSFFIQPSSFPGNSDLFVQQSLGIFFLLLLLCFNIFVPLFVIATNNRYSVLGVLRSFSLMFCFEILITWCLISTASLYETLSLNEIQILQSAIFSNLSGFHDMGGLCICLFIFLLLELNRVPFDLAEEESVTVAGVFTEYKGFTFAAFFLAEYLMMYIASCIVSVLFLGNTFTFFFMFSDLFFFSVYVIFFLLVMVLLRSSLPRVRTDHTLWLGWIIAIPLSFIFFIFSFGFFF